MKLKVLDIPEEGMELTAKAAEDPWFLTVVQDAYDKDYPKGNYALVDLDLIRTGNNIQISGLAEIDLKPSCHRCAEGFERHAAVTIQTTLAPQQEMHFTEGEEQELAVDDVSFAFYKGEEIELGAIVREALVLDIPIRYLCSESCKGLCPQCGMNLNTGQCACATKTGDPRFAVLKDLLKS